MANYINQEKFIDWYRSVSKKELRNEQELLEKVLNDFCATRKEKFTVPASESKTGKDETYKFRGENLGCCGASTMFVYF